MLVVTRAPGSTVRFATRLGRRPRPSPPATPDRYGETVADPHLHLGRGVAGGRGRAGAGGRQRSVSSSTPTPWSTPDPSWAGCTPPGGPAGPSWCSWGSPPRTSGPRSARASPPTGSPRTSSSPSNGCTPWSGRTTTTWGLTSPSWWHGRKAVREWPGSSEGGPADVVLADGTPVYVDGGPLPAPPACGDVTVVHRFDAEAGRGCGRPAAPCHRRCPWRRTNGRRSGTPSGPARVIAPAGSGKTRVLTERLRDLVGGARRAPLPGHRGRLQHHGGRPAARAQRRVVGPTAAPTSAP